MKVFRGEKGKKKGMTGSSNDHKSAMALAVLFNVIPMWILFAVKGVLVDYTIHIQSQASRQSTKVASMIEQSEPTHLSYAVFTICKAYNKTVPARTCK